MTAIMGYVSSERFLEKENSRKMLMIMTKMFMKNLSYDYRMSVGYSAVNTDYNSDIQSNSYSYCADTLIRKMEWKSFEENPRGIFNLAAVDRQSTPPNKVRNIPPFLSTKNFLSLSADGYLVDYRFCLADLYETGFLPKSNTETELYLKYIDMYLGQGKSLLYSITSIIQRLAGKQTCSLLSYKNPKTNKVYLWSNCETIYLLLIKGVEAVFFTNSQVFHETLSLIKMKNPLNYMIYKITKGNIYELSPLQKSIEVNKLIEIPLSEIPENKFEINGFPRHHWMVERLKTKENDEKKESRKDRRSRIKMSLKPDPIDWTMPFEERISLKI